MCNVVTSEVPAMSDAMLFLTELSLSLGVSALSILWFTPLLRDVLTETCGTERRARFWVRYTQFMLVMSPLLMVVLLSEVAEVPQPNALVLLQDTLFRVLLGIFLALLVVGQVIWRSIRRMTVEPHVLPDGPAAAG